MALSGVRSSWLILARNWDLCWLATSSCRLLSSISWKRCAFWIANTDCAAKVCSRSIVCLGNSPGLFRRTKRAPRMRSAPSRGNGAVAGPQNHLQDLGWGLVAQIGHLQRRAFTRGLTDAGVSNADASLLQRRDQLFVRAVGGALPEFVCGLVVVIDR